MLPSRCTKKHYAKCLVIVNGKIWSFTTMFRVLVCYGSGVVIVIVPWGIFFLMYVMYLIRNSSKKYVMYFLWNVKTHTHYLCFSKKKV